MIFNRRGVFNRRGLSDVVTTVLIILLVLAAIVIVWSFVRPTLQRGSENIDIQARCLDLTATVVSCEEQVTAGKYDVTVRNDNNVPTRMRIVFTNATGVTVKDTSIDTGAYAESGTDFKGVTNFLGGAPNVTTNTVKVMPLVKDTANVYQPCEAQLTSAFTCVDVIP